MGSIPVISTINDMLQLSEVKKFEVVHDEERPYLIISKIRSFASMRIVKG